MNENEIYEALQEEFERRVGFPFEELSDRNEWVREILEGTISREEVVSRFIEKYDLDDLEAQIWK